jgi:FMN phosphatase YigB (HAD superfamily)
VSLPSLAALARDPACRLVSSDLFDTVLLRDSATETERLAESAYRAATRLGVRHDALVTLRWCLHDAAYRAVELERPSGEATLAAMTRVLAGALGLGAEAAEVLRATEVEVDASHLHPNRPLLDMLAGLRRDDTRVVAVSDTYYSERDLQDLLRTVVGEHPFQAVYASAELGVTKHAGSIFSRVCELEQVEPGQVVHVGDSTGADVAQAAAAGWRPVHLPRSRLRLTVRRAVRVTAVPSALRRAR